MALRPKTIRARRLRRNATDAEQRLWYALREAAPDLRVRRQHPVGLYVVDIAVPSQKLAIELDGGQHALAKRSDLARTDALQGKGYRVIRFWNNDVLMNTEGVVELILLELGRPPTSP